MYENIILNKKKDNKLTFKKILKFEYFSSETFLFIYRSQLKIIMEEKPILNNKKSQ